LLASALRDPEIMRRQGDRLIRCIDALPTQVDDPLNALM
jgi:hypothetical protein